MPGPARVGVTAAAVVGAAIMVGLVSGLLEPVDLLLPGRESPSAALIRQDFGEIEFRSEVGFDGQQYYAVARHFPRFTDARPYVDSVGYRALRPVAPAVSSLGGKGAPVVAIFVVLNLAGLALACGGLAAIAGDHGRPAAFGYAAAVPLLGPVLTSTPEPVAYGLMLCGLVAARRRRTGLAVAMCALAVLSRETAAVVVASVAAAALVDDRPQGRRFLAVAGATLTVLAGWAAVVAVTVGSPLKRQLDFLGLLDAGAASLAVAGVCAATLAVGAWAWRDVPVAWPVCAVFLAAIPFLHKDNLGLLGLPRLAAPGLALGLAAAAGWWHRNRTGQRAHR